MTIAKRIRDLVIQHAPRGAESCAEPNEPMPDPPGATPEQQLAALNCYLKYLEEFYNDCAPEDCKCKDERWRRYRECRYAVYAPPA